MEVKLDNERRAVLRRKCLRTNCIKRERYIRQYFIIPSPRINIFLSNRDYNRLDHRREVLDESAPVEVGLINRSDFNLNPLRNEQVHSPISSSPNKIEISQKILCPQIS